MYKQYTESSGNSIKFSLSNADKEQLALFWLRIWLTDMVSYRELFCMGAVLEGQRAAITVGTNDGSLTYLTDIDRQPDREERSREKQSSS